MRFYYLNSSMYYIENTSYTEMTENENLEDLQDSNSDQVVNKQRQIKLYSYSNQKRK